MSLIYILQEDGQQSPLEESEVRDLLLRQALSPETPFWKEGMDEWRPLSELPPMGGAHFVPPRRTPGSVSTSANPVTTFQPPVKPAQSTATGPIRFQSTPDQQPSSRRRSGRYRLRFNLIPLTGSMQILYAISFCVTGYLIYQCLSHILGWGAGASSDPMAVLMGNADVSGGNKVGVSTAEMTKIYYLFGTAFSIHIVLEILFYFWIYYASKNGRGMASNMIYTPGWSVGYFFIPFVNLFRPYQVMQELWKVSMNPKGWIGRRGSIFVGFWFLVRLCSTILGRGPFRTSYSESDDPAVRAVGTLIYLTTIEGFVLLVELTTLILVTIVTWRQIRWSRQASA